MSILSGMLSDTDRESILYLFQEGPACKDPIDVVRYLHEHLMFLSQPGEGGRLEREVASALSDKLCHDWHVVVALWDVHRHAFALDGDRMHEAAERFHYHLEGY